MKQLAYLTHEGKTYLVQRERDAFEPSSAVTDLIQILWQQFGSDALKMVREPIFHTGELTEMDHGMIAVSAKRTRRLTGTIEGMIAGLGKNLFDLSGKMEVLSLGFESPKQELDIPSALHIAEKVAALCNNTDRDLKMAERNRAIGAVLLNNKGEVLAVGANNAGKDRTRHAEVNLVQSYFQKTKKPIPVGATLVTTMKPCKMCGGMLWTAAEDPLSLKIVYKEFDPGPNGSISVLTANSFERKRACAHIPDAIGKVIEVQAENQA
jgi:tRNA(Arg) A34 adenosine deaminase TadA